jgi:hypothetical protein
MKIRLIMHADIMAHLSENKFYSIIITPINLIIDRILKIT